MSYIKNKYFEEINKRPVRFEDEEFFNEKKQVKTKPINGNGKEKQSNKSNQDGQKG